MSNRIRMIKDMTDEELVEHYNDMAHLSKSNGTEHDKAFFQSVVLEMAQRFVYKIEVDGEV